MDDRSPDLDLGLIIDTKEVALPDTAAMPDRVAVVRYESAIGHQQSDYRASMQARADALAQPKQPEPAAPEARPFHEERLKRAKEEFSY